MMLNAGFGITKSCLYMAWASGKPPAGCVLCVSDKDHLHFVSL